MSRRTKVPSLPDPTKENIVEVARSVKDALDVREGRTGDSLDKFVSFRDLKALTLIADGETDAGDGTKIPGVVSIPGTGVPNYGTPPSPTGFIATGGYGVIILDWDTPQALYSNHAHTQIWRSNIDSLAEAKMIGTSIAAVYTDPVPDAATFYYWIRFVSDTNVIGPWNSTSGTPATSAINVPRVIEALTGQINSSHLNDYLRSRIDLIDANPDVDGSVSWRIQEQAKETSAAITKFQDSVSSLAESMSIERSIQTATFGDLYAGIAEESTTRASEDAALSTRITTVQAAVGVGAKVFFQASAPANTTTYALRAGDIWYDTSNANKSYKWSGTAWVEFRNSVRVFYQPGEPNAGTDGPFQVGDLWYDSDDRNRPRRWSGSAWEDIRDAEALARVQDETTARIAANEILAGRLTTVEASGSVGAKVFFQTTQPASTSSYTLRAGDIWYDTANANKSYKYSGSTWVEFRNSVRVFYQSTEPNAGTDGPFQVGDMWYDSSTAGKNKPHRWNGSAWQDVRDQEALARIQTEQEARIFQDGVLAGQVQTIKATAESRNRVFFQTSQPNAETQGPFVAGDVWYDTDEGNKSYRWNGSSWVEYRNSVRVFYQPNQPDAGTLGPFQVGDLWYHSGEQNKPYRWDGTGWSAIPDGAPQALITNLEQTKIGYATLNSTGEVFDNNGVIKDKAGVTAWNAANPGNQATWNVGLPLATAVKQVSVSDGATSVSLEQRFTAQRQTNGQLLGQYTIKIDNNGYVSGFGLASESTAAGVNATFAINANRFYIATPVIYDYAAYVDSYSDLLAAWTAGGGDKATFGYTHWIGSGQYEGRVRPTGANQIVPFIVQTTPAVINGVNVPTGVYMDSAYIRDGTITNAKIGNATITDAKIANLTVTDAKIANGAITSLKIADSIQSNDWGTNTGWQINRAGTATFNNAVVRGTVFATNGSFTGTIYASAGQIGGINIGGINIGGGSLATQNYSSTTGWGIFADGSAYFSNITIRDSSGNILLSSGGKIPWSSLLGIPSGIYNSEISIGSNGTLSGGGGGQVTLGGLGAGSLATQSYVAVGDNVRILDNGQYVTLNTSDFVNRLSQINSNTISTFIASGAIGNAYIGNAAIQNANIANAAVSTLSINGGAVTSMAYDEIPGGENSLGAAGSVDAVDVDLTMATGSTGVVIIGYVNIRGDGGGATIQMEIKRGSTSLRSVGVSVVDGFYGSFTISAFDSTPANGNNTYKLTLTNPNNGNPGDNVATKYANAAITVTGGKR